MMQHARAAEIHQTRPPSSYQLLPALGILWLSADPSAHRHAARHSAAPAKFAEPTTDNESGFCHWVSFALEQTATLKNHASACVVM